MVWFRDSRSNLAGRSGFLQMMPIRHRLVHFALPFALSQTLAITKVAVQHLAYVLENNDSDEKSFNCFCPELRNILPKTYEKSETKRWAPLMSALARTCQKKSWRKLFRAKQAEMWALKKKNKAKLEAAEPGNQTLTQTTVRHVFKTTRRVNLFKIPIQLQSFTDFPTKKKKKLLKKNLKRKKNWCLKNRPKQFSGFTLIFTNQ